MPISFLCVGCSHKLQVPDEAVGAQAKCPVCGTVMLVPAGGSVSDEGEVSQESQSEADSPFGAAGGPPQGPPAYMPYGPVPGSPFVAALDPRRFSIGEVWGDTWAIYKYQLWLIIGVAVLAWVISFGFNLGGEIVKTVAVSTLGPAAAPIAIVVAIVSQVFQTWIGIGLFIYLLNMVAGREANINDLFAGMRYLLRYIGASILFALGALAIVLVFALVVMALSAGFGVGVNQQGPGNVFVVISGIVTGLGVFCFLFYTLTFSLWPLLLIDRNMGVFESFGISAELMRGNRLNYFFIQLATGILCVLIGLFTCGIGFVFALPFYVLMSVVLYYHIAGLPIGRMYRGY